MGCNTPPNKNIYSCEDLPMNRKEKEIYCMTPLPINEMIESHLDLEARRVYEEILNQYKTDGQRGFGVHKAGFTDFMSYNESEDIYLYPKDHKELSACCNCALRYWGRVVIILSSEFTITDNADLKTYI